MIVYRQDGSPVELSEEEAQKWIKHRLATAENPIAAPVTPAVTIEPSADDPEQGNKSSFFSKLTN